jgi:hypothetical protein
MAAFKRRPSISALSTCHRKWVPAGILVQTVSSIERKSRDKANTHAAVRSALPASLASETRQTIPTANSEGRRDIPDRSVQSQARENAEPETAERHVEGGKQHRHGNGGDQPKAEIAAHGEQKIAVDEDGDGQHIRQKRPSVGEGVKQEAARSDHEGDGNQPQSRPVPGSRPPPEHQGIEGGRDEGGVGHGIQRLGPEPGSQAFAIAVDGCEPGFGHGALPWGW